MGRHRYVAKRSLAWLVGYRRLQVRYEWRADLLLGFLQLYARSSAAAGGPPKRCAVGAGVRGSVPIRRRP